jgi:stage II sporulation protein D
MMNLAVGLVQGRSVVEVELMGVFTDPAGKPYAPGRYRFSSEISLVPTDLQSCAFAVEDVTIGIGFHWERNERQVFRGSLRISKRDSGLTAINDVPLEEYVTSVISSEMSASCPIELLKAHAVISRSWLMFGKIKPNSRAVTEEHHEGPVREIVRWYGREAHADFDVCADDHCQRYQGITKSFADSAFQAVRETQHQFLTYGGTVCDARFSKCCGGTTEIYSTAWENQDVPYLKALFDGPGQLSFETPEALIRSDLPAYCNTDDTNLLALILPGFDQETRDFYRWRLEYTSAELGELVHARLGMDLGPIRDLQPLARGPSGRIYRLRIQGEKDEVIIGKELEIRRALSRSHLYSSAFLVEKLEDRFVLNGAGWGHGVGLCQIGAAVMASTGKGYREILAHYYPGSEMRTGASIT